MFGLDLGWLAALAPRRSASLAIINSIFLHLNAPPAGQLETASHVFVHARMNPQLIISER
eukprot:1799251-Heterocapsa_arctica.AAC.1